MDDVTMSDNADSGRWIDVLDDASLREGEMCAVYPLGRNVVIARVDGVAPSTGLARTWAARCSPAACRAAS